MESYGAKILEEDNPEVKSDIFPHLMLSPTGCLQIVENSAERLKDW